MADVVNVSVSPSRSLSSSPPCSNPMYCSPSRPDVRILALESTLNAYFLSKLMRTFA